MPMLRRHDPTDASGPTDPAPTDAHAHTSLLGRALMAWTRLCLRAPMAIVLGAVISAVIAGAYTAQSLGYKVSRVDLLDPKSDYNKLWIDYIHEFGEESGVRPHLAVDQDGRFWLLGGNYTCPRPGITD